MSLEFICCENMGRPRNKTASYFKDTISGKVIMVAHSSKEEPKVEDIKYTAEKIKVAPKSRAMYTLGNKELLNVFPLPALDLKKAIEEKRAKDKLLKGKK